MALPNYVENALELLDEPGEWYLDQPAKTMYYKPRPGEDLTKAPVVVPALETLVEMRGASIPCGTSHSGTSPSPTPLGSSPAASGMQTCRPTS